MRQSNHRMLKWYANNWLSGASKQNRMTRRFHLTDTGRSHSPSHFVSQRHAKRFIIGVISNGSKLYADYRDRKGTITRRGSADASKRTGGVCPPCILAQGQRASACSFRARG